MKTKIPLPYKIILRKLWSHSEMGKIKIRNARKILCWHFRMGKENFQCILKEMKKEGYINSYYAASGIEIIPRLKDLS